MPINKPADAKYEINTLIKNRWSPRAFENKSVDNEILNSLFEAARWAASCNNSQPWRFIIAKKENPEEYAKALSCFNENNQKTNLVFDCVFDYCMFLSLTNPEFLT